MASVGITGRTNGRRARSPDPRLGAYIESLRLEIERETHLLELRRLHALNLRLTSELQASMRELRDSRARIMSVAVQERRRIERDLHDGAQQLLVAAQIRVGLARDLIAEQPERGQEILQSVEEDLQQALQELRSLGHGVYPAVLSDKGIGPALREVARHSPLDVTVDPDGAGRYSPEIESAVYFCCLESLQNAAKHAQGATSASITVSAGAELSFVVTDDGAGFSPGVTPAGAGLTNMRDRLAAVDGRLELQSAPGGGTCVVGTIPLQTTV